MYNVDGFITTPGTLASMKSAGLLPICYISIGTWEPYRPDAALFPDSVKGGSYDPPFAVERWLDVRSPVVRDLMVQRLETMKNKGCIAIEPDNSNGYASYYTTNFPFTMNDWRDYIVFLSQAARAKGMYWGLKNSYELIETYPEMVSQGVWDYGINEECHVYDECFAWILFKNEGLPVFQVQYTYNYDESNPEASATRFRAEVCPLQSMYGLTSILKAGEALADPLYLCP